MFTVKNAAHTNDSALVAAAILGVYSLRLLLDVYDIGRLEPVAKGIQLTLPPDVASDTAAVVRVVLATPETFSVMAGRVAGLEFIEANREDGLRVEDLHLAIGDRVTGRR